MEFRQSVRVQHSGLKRTRAYYVLPIAGKHKWIDLAILIFINLLNYTDRYVFAGDLDRIETFFTILEGDIGLIQTVSQIFYILTAPLFGYLGDRFNRRILLVFGVVIWNGANLSASFVETGSYWTFLSLRGLFGVGEACFTIIAPTIIGDLFTDDLRSKVLAAFYMAIPVGNGLGYVLAAQVTKLLGDWRWSFRIIPMFSVVSIFLLVFILKVPKRGLVEDAPEEESGWKEDIKYLLKNPTFILATFGYTAVSFTVGIVSLFLPILNVKALRIKYTRAHQNREIATFGGVTLLAGISGIALAYFVTSKIRDRFPWIDPVVCGVGMALSAPFFIAASYCILFHKAPTYILIYFAYGFMVMTFAATVDITLNVVIPTKRSSAMALQLFIAHALGDVISPYIAGEISDALESVYKEDMNQKKADYVALQHAHFLGYAVEFAGSLFFFAAALTIVKDKKKVKEYIEEKNEEM